MTLEGKLQKEPEREEYYGTPDEVLPDVLENSINAFGAEETKQIIGNRLNQLGVDMMQNEDACKGVEITAHDWFALVKRVKKLERWMLIGDFALWIAIMLNALLWWQHFAGGH